MDAKQKRFNEPDLELRLKTLTPEESNNRISTLDEAVNFELKHCQVDPNMDLKKLRRTISNRLSAQRSRAKQAEYMAELEKQVNDLENIAAWRGSAVEIAKVNKNKVLLENAMLHSQLDILTYKSNLSTATTGELMFEIQRLKELAKAQKDKVPGMDVDQYLSFGAMPKNGNM